MQFPQWGPMGPHGIPIFETGPHGRPMQSSGPDPTEAGLCLYVAILKEKYRYCLIFFFFKNKKLHLMQGYPDLSSNLRSQFYEKSRKYN
jgi:hypothetical protein